MSRMILEPELLQAVKENTFIKKGSIKCCEGMKYDFRVSNKLLSPRFNQEREFDDKDEGSFVIKSGETAYVYTEEDLDLPPNIFCQLSHKRKLSHDGILLLGGFSVDPGYKGKLFFGMHNLSREDYPFRPGKKLVAGVFYELSPEEAAVIKSAPESLTDFPDELIKNVKSFKSASTEALESQIEGLKNSVALLREQIDTDNAWKNEFKHGLSENNEQIFKIGESLNNIAKKLEQEIDERKSGERVLASNFSVVKGIGLVLSALLGGGLVSLVVLYIAGILNFSS